MAKIKNSASTTPVYSWSVDKYIKFVENTQNPTLRDYEDKELDYILKISDLSSKTIIDVGAGYGRVLPYITPHFKKCNCR